MSRRQDERKKAKVKRQKASIARRADTRSVFTFSFFLFPFALKLNIHHFPRIQILKKPHGFIVIELHILSFDHQKETVARCQRKARRVENRVIGLRQLVQRQHAEHRGERGAQDRAFKRYRNERGPTVERLAADDEGIVNHLHPVLHEKATERSEYSTRKHNERQRRALEPNRFVQLFDRKRRVAVNLPIAGLVRRARRRDQLTRIIELGHHAV